ncbi:MAG: EAL domain-containing protein [Acetobacteraceae bacterium]|nr:EAL domain-containing protein [Acetobacteraceae bacterium]
MRLIGGALLLGIAIVASAVVLSWQARQSALSEASRELRNMSFVLADHTERALQAVEFALAAVTERTSHDGAFDSEDALRHWARSEAVHEALRNRSRVMPQVSSLILVDADGRLTGSSRSFPPPPNDLSDREYFLALRDGEPRVIGRPVQNRGSGTWAFHFARRIERSDGTFLGAAVGVIELAYFERLYTELALNPSSSISLFRTDGILMVRHPQPITGPGTIPADLTQFQLPVDAPASAVLQAMGVDGEQRLISPRQLTDYPLRLHVGVRLAAVLDAWRNVALRIAGGALLLLLLLTTAAIAALRALRAEAHVATSELRFEREATAARLRHQQALANKDAEFRVIVEGMSLGVWMFDACGGLVLANGPGATIPGVPAHALRRGATIEELGRACLAWGRSEARDVMLRLQNLSVTRAAAEFVQALPAGRVAMIKGQPLVDGRWLVTFEDISERHAAEAKARYLSQHDPLTGLANRAKLIADLSQAVAEHPPGGSGAGRLAVLYLDLDRFKGVNDTLGHKAGDLLLAAVADRITSNVRTERNGGDLVARLGGDEFAVVLTVTGREVEEARADVEAVASRLVECLSQPFLIDGHRVVVGTTVGVALHPEDGAAADDLLRAADLALYRAKDEGRGRHRFFEPAMETEAQARRALESDLRCSLLEDDGRDFDLHFQPFVDIARLAPTGCEALVRWRRPGLHGLVSPASFIAVAEETGLIGRLGEVVLRRACSEAASWADRSLRIAVNVSPAQLRMPGFVEVVQDALRCSGLEPARLELEITESVLMQQTDGVLATMRDIGRLGVGFAMDDFGTGYSSLSYLRAFPFERVKIDRSFIQDIDSKPGDLSILRAIAQLCRELDMKAVVEGVETESQLDLAQSAGCLEAQGYLFSRPVTAADLPATLARLRVLDWTRATAASA